MIDKQLLLKPGLKILCIAVLMQPLVLLAAPPNEQTVSANADSSKPPVTVADDSPKAGESDGAVKKDKSILKTGDEFKPSEEVSEDLSIAFPVDI